MDVVVAGEAAESTVAMLADSYFQIVGDADVQGPRLAGENVDVIAMLHRTMIAEWLREKL